MNNVEFNHECKFVEKTHLMSYNFHMDDSLNATLNESVRLHINQSSSILIIYYFDHYYYFQTFFVNYFFLLLSPKEGTTSIEE